MTASKTLPSPHESQHLWLAFASGVIATAFAALYFWFARDSNPRLTAHAGAEIQYPLHSPLQIRYCSLPRE